MTRVYAGSNLLTMIKTVYGDNATENTFKKITAYNKLQNPDFLQTGQDIYLSQLELSDYEHAPELERLKQKKIFTLQDIIKNAKNLMPLADISKQFERPLPMNGVTSYFGYRRNPFLPGVYTFTNHSGIDISAKPWHKITAANDGVVIFAGYFFGYGKTIVIKHSNGSDDYYSVYGHGQKLTARVGDQVWQGKELGTVGQTGQSTGIHLHFEILDSLGRPLNPLALNNIIKPQGQSSIYQELAQLPKKNLTIDYFLQQIKNKFDSIWVKIFKKDNPLQDLKKENICLKI